MIYEICSTNRLTLENRELHVSVNRLTNAAEEEVVVVLVLVLLLL